MGSIHTVQIFPSFRRKTATIVKAISDSFSVAFSFFRSSFSLYRVLIVIVIYRLPRIQRLVEFRAPGPGYVSMTTPTDETTVSKPSPQFTVAISDSLIADGRPCGWLRCSSAWLDTDTRDTYRVFHRCEPSRGLRNALSCWLSKDRPDTGNDWLRNSAGGTCDPDPRLVGSVSWSR